MCVGVSNEIMKNRSRPSNRAGQEAEPALVFSADGLYEFISLMVAKKRIEEFGPLDTRIPFNVTQTAIGTCFNA